MKALALCCSNKNNWHMTKGDADIYKVMRWAMGIDVFPDLDARRRHGDYLPVATRGYCSQNHLQPRKAFSPLPATQKETLEKGWQDAVHNKSFYCKFLSHTKTRKPLETEKSLFTAWCDWLMRPDVSRKFQRHHVMCACSNGRRILWEPKEKFYACAGWPTTLKWMGHHIGSWWGLGEQNLTAGMWHDKS